MRTTAVEAEVAATATAEADPEVRRRAKGDRGAIPSKERDRFSAGRNRSLSI